MSEYTFSIPCTGTETYTVEADWDATPSLDHLQGGEA